MTEIGWSWGEKITKWSVGPGRGVHFFWYCSSGLLGQDRGLPPDIIKERLPNGLAVDLTPPSSPTSWAMDGQRKWRGEQLSVTRLPTLWVLPRSIIFI